jgi:3',5'-cyclic AMP phosphodiesterase CpdA
MRTIAHLSDLHFGALDERLLEPLRQTLHRSAPDLIAISGDLTQRARRAQFRRARAFLDQLHAPLLVVPGNHDVPLYDLAARFADPLRRYRRYITSDLTPVHADDEVLVVGLNSTHAYAFRHGRGKVRTTQVLSATARLNLAPPHVVRIVVTHHPFDLPIGHDEHHLIGGATMAMGWLAAAGVNVFLAGHLHVSHIGQTAERYRIAGHSALVVQAGTMSRRLRGEPVAFNVLHVSAQDVTVIRHTWSDGEAAFVPSRTERFERAPEGWRARAIVPAALQ